MLSQIRMCASVCYGRVKDYSNPTIARIGFPDNSFRSRLRTRNTRILHSNRRSKTSTSKRNGSGSSPRTSFKNPGVIAKSSLLCCAFAATLGTDVNRSPPSLALSSFSFHHLSAFSSFASFSIRPNKSLFSPLPSEYNDVRGSHMQRR